MILFRHSESLFLLSTTFLSLRKQPTFCKAPTGFPIKCHLRNDCRSSVLDVSLSLVEANFPHGTINKNHYPDHCGIPAVIFQTPFRKRNQWCYREMSTVFSDYTFLSLIYMPWTQAYLTIISQARMGPESRGHEGERNNIVLVKSN